MHTGPPSPPEPQLLVLNATAIQISWLPPFSWAVYPIVNYTVQIHNRVTGETINSTINATVTRKVIDSTLNTTNETGSGTVSEEEVNSNATFTSTTAAPVSFIHNAPREGVVQNCEELVFSVFAANNIGWSSPAEVTGGFPIGNVCFSMVSSS